MSVQLSNPPFVNADDATLEKIRRVIAVQFDVEIEYKRRELRLIEDRLQEGEMILERLQEAWANRTSILRCLGARAHLNAFTKHGPPPLHRRLHATGHVGQRRRG
jgi:hypothetical protein